MSFGQTLRALRADRQLTQLALAVQADMTPESICRLEAGERKPNWETVQALARALNVDVGVFVNGKEKT